MSSAKVFFVRHGNELEERYREGLEWLDIKAKIREYNKVYIKPNLTYSIFKEGVTVTPLVLEIIVKLMRDLTKNIFIIEGPGGYGLYNTRDAFIGHNLDLLVKKYDCQLIEAEKEKVEFLNIDDGLKVPVPACLLDENTRLVTIAVPKVHAMTGISLCVKNQWGLISDPMRLRYHYEFDRIITHISRKLNPTLSIIDGTYGLTRNGPIMEGEPFAFGISVLSDNCFAADKIMRSLMGWSMKKVSYLDYADRKGLIPQNILTNGEQSLSAPREFYLKRNLWNYGAKLAFHSKFFTHVFYDSALSGPLHKIMYSLRKRPEFPRFTDSFSKD